MKEKHEIKNTDWYNRFNPLLNAVNYLNNELLNEYERKNKVAGYRKTPEFNLNTDGYIYYITFNGNHIWNSDDCVFEDDIYGYIVTFIDSVIHKMVIDEITKKIFKRNKIRYQKDEFVFGEDN